jgi:hypothetical protein
VPASSRSTATTKRVRIASPPVPISPETPTSYVSSPEVTRYANLPGSPPPPGSEDVPYAQAVASNPFQASLLDGEQDEVDEELCENTRRNSALRPGAGIGGENGQPDPVKATLARFAGVPRRSIAPLAPGSGEQSDLTSSRATPRPALDVDAFKRLLLTGESGVPIGPAMPASAHAPSQPILTSDSSSSNADTASVSQQSIFEPVASAVTDTPRTSLELDREEATGDRRSLLAKTPIETHKKPPIPRPRHGKSFNVTTTSSALSISPQATQWREIADAPASENARVASPSDLNKPLPPPPIDSSFPLGPDSSESPVLQTSTPVRRPPTLPLTRRRSQHRSQSLQEPYTTSSKFSPEVNASIAPFLDQESSVLATKAPRPPPTRRQKRASDILGPSSFELPVQEEDEANITSTQPQLSLSPSPSISGLSQSKPQPPPSRTPSAAKRSSRVPSGSPTMAPPPVPPPRRARGSSRSSFDNQTAALPQESRISGEHRRPSTESSRNMSGPSTSNDILADLAALQMEVDALRHSQTHEASNT